MIYRDRDPASMTATERCAEIAEILASGYLRLQISRSSKHNTLADHGQSMASCDLSTMNPKSREGTA